MARVLVLGYNACDVICPVPSLPEPDSKLEVPAVYWGGGGPAATAAVALAKLGAEVRLVTVLTDDIPGRLQREELEAAGVDFSLSTRVSGYRSPQAVILVNPDNEERTILWSRGNLPRLEPAAVNGQWLAGTDLLYLDSHEPRAALVLAREASARGLPVVLDGGTARDGMAELVPHCSDVISSGIFAPRLTGQLEPVAALRSLARLGPRRVAMTFGKAGCLALVGDAPVHVPAFEVPTCDTTGAGDVFHAGYAFARTLGLDWLPCLEYGSAVAALKCRDWGGRRGLPTRREVETMLATGKRRSEKPSTTD
ncbi:MAG: PfkB family carbohydrate kinase [bacterium]